MIVSEKLMKLLEQFGNFVIDFFWLVSLHLLWNIALEQNLPLDVELGVPIHILLLHHASYRFLCWMQKFIHRNLVNHFDGVNIPRFRVLSLLLCCLQRENEQLLVTVVLAREKTWRFAPIPQTPRRVFRNANARLNIREIGNLELGWKIVPKIGVWRKQGKGLFYTNRRDSIGIFGSWDCQHEEPILNFGRHQLGIRINRYLNALFEFSVLPFGNKIGVIVCNHFSFSLPLNDHIVFTDIHTASLFGHSGNICNNDIIIGSLHGEVYQTPTSIISKSTENWSSPERCLAMKVFDQHYCAILALATACRE